jgi:hypothetical protein
MELNPTSRKTGGDGHLEPKVMGRWSSVVSCLIEGMATLDLKAILEA